MPCLWDDVKAQEFASAEPESWSDYLDNAPTRSHAPLSAVAGIAEHAQTDRRRDVPPSVRWAVWERDDFRCQHCGVRQFLTIDHKYPYSRGGPLLMDNLQTLCKSCNSRKGARIVSRR